MNRKEMIAAALLVIAVTITFNALSQVDNPLAIQWHWNNGKLFERYSRAQTLQFGLRSDGIVVWREIVSSTNSPAEFIPIRHRSEMTPTVVPQSPPPLPR